MTCADAQNHPVIGKIITENPQFFGEEIGSTDWEQMVLTLYLLYEFSLGDKSFWKPYLDLMPDVKFFCYWQDSEIFSVQDYALVKEAMTFKEEVEAEWRQFHDIVAKYEIFDHTVLNKGMFMRLLSQCCTRCFGFGLPSTSMVPMGDNMNHSHVTVVQEIVNKPLHLKGEVESNYFQKTKFMNDYSVIFGDYEGETALERINIKGRFIRENFEANQQYSSTDSYMTALQ